MVQNKLPLINSEHGSETRNIINELIRLFNGMGHTYDESLKMSREILENARQTNNMNKDVQAQINTLIAESGTSDAELLQARVDSEGVEYPVLKMRLDKSDKEIDEIDEKIIKIKDYMEIEPEDLRESDSETDGDLLQKAFTLAEGLNRNNVSIKLGRIYKIGQTITVGNSISYKNQSHLIVRGDGGGLQLDHDGFMFDGNNNSGGLHFQNVKFNGITSRTHPWFNTDNIIQVIFNGCQFANTGTILQSNEEDGYLQSCRFIGCNFKGMRNYQIKGAMAYDLDFSHNVVEWGVGGLIDLTQSSLTQYASIGVTISDNIIEGISEQIPIKTTHNGNMRIENNYFEGNNYPDIDMSGSLLSHRSLTIKGNSFGNYSSVYGKDASVKVGKLYNFTGYDFSGNSGSQLIFDFTDSGGDLINMTNSRYLFNGNLSYKGIDSKRMFWGDTSKPKASTQLTIGGGASLETTFNYISPQELFRNTYFVKLGFNHTNSTHYRHNYSGFLSFISGLSSSGNVEMKVMFQPILNYGGTGLNETDKPLIVTFKSSESSNRITPDITSPITETIVFTSPSEYARSGDEGYIINMDEIIKNQ